jgi:hypothetical protein
LVGSFIIDGLQKNLTFGPSDVDPLQAQA